MRSGTVGNGERSRARALLAVMAAAALALSLAAGCSSKSSHEAALEKMQVACDEYDPIY